MSLILDALKKSEAERQLGRAPGLLTPAATPGRRHGMAALVIAVAVAVALSVGLTWWLLRPAGEPPPAAADAALQPAPPVDAQSPPATVPAPAPAPAAATATVAAPPDRAAVPASPPAAGLAREPAPVAEPSRRLERESAPQPAGGALPLPVPAPPATVAPAAGPAAADTAPAPATSPEPAEPAGPALPRLRDLPAGLRDALPPLRLSMHVFNEDPAQRFVLIDGRRLGEGAALAEALVVEEIRRDGVVLRFREQRFFLQRPG